MFPEPKLALERTGAAGLGTVGGRVEPARRGHEPGNYCTCKAEPRVIKRHWIDKDIAVLVLSTILASRQFLLSIVEIRNQVLLPVKTLSCIEADGIIGFAPTK